MAVISNALLQALRTAFYADYRRGLQNAESHYQKVASVVPSSTASNTYGWLGEMPSMREWIGDRVIKDIKEHGYTIANKDWESTIGILKTAIEDDNLGQYVMAFEDMGMNAQTHPDELVFGLMKDGENQLCYDGQGFFDTDHPVYAEHDQTGTPTTWSNYVAGAEVPFYLINADRAVKPIIFQNRKSPEFTAMTNREDEQVFMNKKFRFGVDSRSNVGFGFPQMAYKHAGGLTSANFRAAFKAMESLKRDGGKPLANTPSMLVVPPHYREEAQELLQAERNAAGATNINRNMVELLVTPWIA